MFLLRNRYATLVVAALLVAAGVVALRVDAGAIPSAGAPAAAAVDVATVASQTITDWHEYSGRLEAVDKVEIRPLVSGDRKSVEEGKRVSVGVALGGSRIIKKKKSTQDMRNK